MHRYLISTISNKYINLALIPPFLGPPFVYGNGVLYIPHTVSTLPKVYLVMIKCNYITVVLYLTLYNIFHFYCFYNFYNNYCYLQFQTSLEYLNLNNLRGRRISFLCGDAGPLALGAVIAYKLSHRRPDDLPDYKVLVQRYAF